MRAKRPFFFECIWRGAKRHFIEGDWTGSIAFGNKPFVEKVKALLGFRAKGRKIVRSGKGYQEKETPAGYNEFLGAENTYFWNLNL